MEFRQLEVFVAVSELKSFSKAAEYLYLSQSTVSSHLRNLEKELQKELVIRSTKNISLTEDGAKFLFYARRILDTKKAALDELCSPSDTLLHLGASTIPSGYLLPELLTGFHDSHPHVFFDIKQGDSSGIQDRVLDGTVDLGLIGKKSDSPKCRSIKFCSDSLAIVTPLNNHFLSLSKNHASVEELLKEPIIMREDGSGTQKAADRFIESLGIKQCALNIIARNNDLESIKQMIINGMGLSILSSLAIKDLRSQGQVLVFPVESRISRDFYITYLKSRELKPVQQEFINYVVSYYRKDNRRDRRNNHDNKK